MLIFILIIIFLMLHIYTALVHRNNRPIAVYKAEPDIYHSFSLLIPCYNEELVLDAVLGSIEHIDYLNFEIIFINDGSTDLTFEKLNAFLKLEKIKNAQSEIASEEIKATYQSQKFNNIYVINKENGGKADSLNAGINLAKNEFVVTLDADSILKDDALLYINNALQDPSIIAIGGNVLPVQCIDNFYGEPVNLKSSGTLLEDGQFLEYIRGFYILKNSYAYHDALAVISGAFGAFRLDIMRELGGFVRSVGEDIDITIKFNHYAQVNDLRVDYEDRAICFTEVPNNWRDLKNQRVRWQKAFLDALRNNYKFLFSSWESIRLTFFILFENFGLLYVSTILTLLYVFVILYDITVIHHLGFLFFFLLIIGTLAFITYNLCGYTLIKNSVLNQKSFPKHRLLISLIYEFFFYRFAMVVIIIYGSIAYFFNRGGWNKVTRNGALDRATK